MIASLAPRYGGPSTVLPEMCGALARRGHEVEVLTTTIDGPGDLDVRVGVPLDLDGATVTYFRVHRPRSYAASLGLARALHRRVREFDVVHVHSLYLFHTLVACRECRRAGVPYVLRPHGTLDPYHRARHRGRKVLYDVLVERRNLERAAAVHFTSAAELAHAGAAGVTATAVVVPLGVDAGAFAGPAALGELAARHPELEGRRLITFLGRISAKKGLDLLLEAFASVADAHADAQLVIAGPDDEGIGERLRSRAAELGLAGRLTLPGFVRGEEKVALLRASSVFALPSADENFAVSVVEALAAETPVVITERVAIHEEVAAAEAGIVVERTPEAVSAALARLLGDPAFARRCGESGGRLARTVYDWRPVAEQLESVYRQAMEPVTHA